jgi:hypothetical protein
MKKVERRMAAQGIFKIQSVIIVIVGYTGKFRGLHIRRG